MSNKTRVALRPTPEGNPPRRNRIGHMQDLEKAFSNFPDVSDNNYGLKVDQIVRELVFIPDLGSQPVATLLSNLPDTYRKPEVPSYP